MPLMKVNDVENINTQGGDNTDEKKTHQHRPSCLDVNYQLSIAAFMDGPCLTLYLSLHSFHTGSHVDAMMASL